MNNKLFETIQNIRAVNTHSHHLQDAFFADIDLDKLLTNTYVDWCGAKFGTTGESRQAYLDKVKYKSYFVWLQKALRELYGLDENLSPSNWDEVSLKIQAEHQDKNWHKNILRDECGYDKVILDAYWNPGSDNGDNTLFASTFRINSFFYGFSKDVRNHNDINVYSLYGKAFTDIDTYMDFVRSTIEEKVSGGCIALKNAVAYDRAIEYRQADKAQASKVFTDLSADNISAFQDYVFDGICDIAAQLDVPIQCHTGLGQLHGTRSINMLSVIERHPNTTFVIFHGGFPWTDDVIALLHNFENVIADICWMPLLSPTVAKTTLHTLIEVGMADKICWGCDTWTSEESLGARIAANHVITDVLSEKIESGYLSESDAVCIAENILANNAKTLYGL